jgi:hypothetical protein
MPTKRTFDLIIITIIGFELAIAIPKAWAAKRLAQGDSGPTKTVAETVMALH